MKTLDTIPTSRLERTGSLLKAGAKVGVNYLKYYTDKISQDEAQAKETLNRNNAEDIYDSLKELKGSALKVAQMLSMEKNMLPAAYVEKFSLSQFSVPPLSGALVRKTFRKYFGQNPEDLFDAFDPDSVNAASIGQVHHARHGTKQLAVKIQYPGVQQSISSDLRMVKPIAMKMFNIQKEGSEAYFDEVESKLLEETDYTLELGQSQEMAHACAHLPNLRFPEYYPEWSCDKILTMDWLDGKHLPEWLAKTPSAEARNKVAQSLWDFYMYQLHVLRKVHADPHPGNFLVDEDNTLMALDFGCVKTIPDDFYIPYFELAKTENLQNEKVFLEKLHELEILLPQDSAEERIFFTELFKQLLELFTQPFNAKVFDFSNAEFFTKIADLAQQYAKIGNIRKMNTNRGSRHFIYVNRTFFGLYQLMFDLGGTQVKIEQYKKYQRA